MFETRTSMGHLAARTLSLGAVAGIRSMSAPAQLSWAASHGRIDGIAKTPFAPLASTRVSRLLTVLAVGEVLADKYSRAPNRVSAPGLFGRAASGALVGAALFVSSGRQGKVGAALGLIAAVAASYPSYYLRVGLLARSNLPNWALGLLEDAFAEGLGTLSLKK
ncbi:MAG TPA: DUF4126 family protein [Rubrobacteraceae bacterium]|nr:DUF4126 family protein [Rubrobacteraceae bacterium]